MARSKPSKEAEHPEDHYIWRLQANCQDVTYKKRAHGYQPWSNVQESPPPSDALQQPQGLPCAKESQQPRGCRGQSGHLLDQEPANGQCRNFKLSDSLMPVYPQPLQDPDSLGPILFQLRVLEMKLKLFS